MNDERYKKIMADLGMPNSRSLLCALQQVANEVEQEVRAALAQPQAPSVPADHDAEKAAFYAMFGAAEKATGHKPSHYDVWLMARGLMTANGRATAHVGLDATAAVPGWQRVPVRPTPEMVAAYLAANHTYWKEMDEGPAPIGKWRNGTPAEATAGSYVAMLAAAPSAPQAQAAPLTQPEQQL